jgi:membrane-bound inhibitor of C-type lysozyme
MGKTMTYFDDARQDINLISQEAEAEFEKIKKIKDKTEQADAAVQYLCDANHLLNMVNNLKAQISVYQIHLDDKYLKI